MKKLNWEEILIALSLANLLFIISWRRLLYPTNAVYHTKFTPTDLDYLSVMLLVILLAGVFLGGLRLGRYFLKEKATFVFQILLLGVLLCIANAVRMVFPRQQLWLMETLGVKMLLVICGVIGVIGLLVVFKFREQFFAGLRLFILILSPFVFVTFFNAVNGIVNSEPETQNSIAFQDSDQTGSAGSPIKSRVIWIIFDELEYKTTFENRPDDVKMPELERFRKETFSATKAVSPAYQTLEAIPSLLTGKSVETATPQGKNELVLQFAKQSEKVDLSKTANVFSDVREMGGETAAVGWYHAYCRVLGKSLSFCEWESFDFGNDFKSDTFLQSIRRDLYNLAISVPLAVRYLKTLEENNYSDRHQRMLAATFKSVTNPEIDLAFIHLPFPHNPYHYSRKADKFTGSGDYLDNLVLTDRVFGEIRSKLEKDNLWDQSAIIVSSDHHWRLDQLKFSLTPDELALSQGIEDKRIPFMVKLAGQTEALEYDQPFNTVITRAMIREIMKGGISTPGEIKEWLDKK
jgi:hypothetical protein